jgi:serine/threonine protein kinase
VLGVLGSGAFAVVYRAHDPALGVDVAIKVLAEPHAHDPELRARFVANARTLRGPSDDRMVTVHDIGEFEGRPYLVMELVNGGTLEDRLGDGQTFGPAEIEWLVTGLGAAIVVVHAAGFVHGDIRPSNVLIRRAAPGDQVVLADFGLAREIDQRQLAVTAGADAYTAPEQRLPGASIDGRTDVYAASGVIGRVAFGSEWRRILVPSGPHQVTALEPPGTEPLAFELRRGLSANPADRHASISEWTQAVSDATTDHAAVIHTEHDAATPRRPVVRLFAAGLIVLAMVLALATVTTQ